MDQKSKNKSRVTLCPKAIGKDISKSKSREQNYSSINEKLHCNIFNNINLFTHDTQHCPENLGESTVQALNLAQSCCYKSVKNEIIKPRMIMIYATIDVPFLFN